MMIYIIRFYVDKTHLIIYINFVKITWLDQHLLLVDHRKQSSVFLKIRSNIWHLSKLVLLKWWIFHIMIIYVVLIAWKFVNQWKYDREKIEYDVKEWKRGSETMRLESKTNCKCVLIISQSLFPISFWLFIYICLL